MKRHCRRFILLTVTALFFVNLVPTLCVGMQPSVDKDKAEKEKVIARFASVPAFFIENKGQTDNKVKYYFKGNDNVYFTDDGVMFQKTVKESKSQESGVKESAVGAWLPRPHREEEATVDNEVLPR